MKIIDTLLLQRTRARNAWSELYFLYLGGFANTVIVKYTLPSKIFEVKDGSCISIGKNDILE